MKVVKAATVRFSPMLDRRPTANIHERTAFLTSPIDQGADDTRATLA